MKGQLNLFHKTVYFTNKVVAQTDEIKRCDDFSWNTNTLNGTHNIKYHDYTQNTMRARLKQTWINILLIRD